MDRLTAYIISTRTDLKITYGGPAENGKYVGWILLDVDSWHPLVNSQPVYDSPEDAEKAMRELVEEVRKAVKEETGGKHPIDHVFWESGGRQGRQVDSFTGTGDEGAKRMRHVAIVLCLLGFHSLEEQGGWSERCIRCGTIKQDTPKGYFYEHPDGKWWFSIMAEMWF